MTDSPRLQGPVGRTVRRGGCDLLYFGGNDYLGLANDPRVKSAAIEATQRYGASFAASTTTTGRSELHDAVEAALADFLAVEDAVVFATGYLGPSVLASVSGPDDGVVVCVGPVHPAGVDAARLIGRTVISVPWPEIVARLEVEGETPGTIITNGASPFGMIAHLERLSAARDAGWNIVVDDAHGIGVVGPDGRGAGAACGVDLPATCGTLSKAFGAMGGFIAGKRGIIDAARRHRMIAGTTSLAPASLAAGAAAVAIAGAEPERRQVALERAQLVRDRLRAAGLAPGGSGTSVVTEAGLTGATARRVAAKLEAMGMVASFVTYPPHPEGVLRCTLTAAHRADDADCLADALIRCVG